MYKCIWVRLVIAPYLSFLPLWAILPGPEQVEFHQQCTIPTCFLDASFNGLLYHARAIRFSSHRIWYNHISSQMWASSFAGQVVMCCNHTLNQAIIVPLAYQVQLLSTCSLFSSFKVSLPPFTAPRLQSLLVQSFWSKIS